MANTRKSSGARLSHRDPDSSPREPEFRVFISYSHEDSPLAKQIATVLKANGIDPMWDEEFSYGQGFHDQIRNYISHAHVFLPVLTPAASARNWVHQEIGYAIALNIPVLPLAVGSLPGELIDRIHAIRLDQPSPKDKNRPPALSSTDLALLRKELSRDSIAALLERQSGSGSTLYSCAYTPDVRNVMLAQHANDVLSMGRAGLVRQKGGLSSFHIPAETPNHKVWKLRYGPVERSEEHRRQQREERIALTKHAVKSGCRLIVKPSLEFKPYGPLARLTRLQALQSFLANPPHQCCEVAMDDPMDYGTSLTIVGNWFAAESVRSEMGRGYYQTIFTRHAPSLSQKIRDFDDEFHELLALQGVSPEDSRDHAMAHIGALIDGIAASLR